MLSERQLQAALKLFDERMQALNEEYLRMMGEHIKGLGKLTASDTHRLVQMKRMNANVESIKRKIAQAMDANIKDVEQVFLAAAESDAKFAATIFGETHSPTIKDNKPLERILKAQLRLTGQSMENLSRTTILSEPYRKAVDVGVTAVQTGLTDYNSAVRRAMREAAGEGLRVKYPNSGLTRRLDTAVRQNILDGVRSINQDVLNQLGKEFGADGVEISAHALCAEDHLPYQGRQFSNKEFADLQNSLDRQIGAWNCKHTVHPILLGISQPTYSDAELEGFRQNSREEIEIDGKTLTRYEWTQEQRRLETQVRYQKDIAVAAKASGDDVLRRETQAKINDLTKQYSRISEKADLIEQRERMAVSGFRRVKASDRFNIQTPAQTNPLQPGGGHGIISTADAAGRFERSSGALGQSYRDALAQRFLQGDSIAQQVYDRFIPNGGAVADGDFTGIPCYRPAQNSIIMSFANDAKNPRGNGTTWFHEHGHFVDFNAGRVSTNLQFAQALSRDCKNYEAAFKRANKLSGIDDVRRGISSELRSQGDVTHSIQDIFGGVSGKFYPGASWGHSTKYWKQKGPTGVCSEAFAHMFEASFDPNKRTLMEKYLPSAWAEFKKILGGMV